MKIPIQCLSLLTLILLSGCNIQSTSQVEIYRSTENSFQKDFYLEIENDLVNVFGWELTSENDTIYYKSSGELDKKDVGVTSFELETYELTRVKTSETNLNDFKEETGLKNALFFHSSFFGKKYSEGSMKLQAVKHIYYDRVDEFEFEKIE